MHKLRRLHPVFNMSQLMALGFGVSAAISTCAWAQEAIYRCGHEYTNAPRDVRQCERMAAQAVTVITGTRPSPPRAVAAAPSTAATEVRTSPETARSAQPQQAERDLHARTIVGQELDKARQQLTLLVQEYNDGEPVKWASESRHHQRYLDRVTALKASIERTQRDIDSLQRELDRRPVVASTRAP
ncbi:hypothetical protein [Limnohabitans sp.]|uniref:hypothetical protein n=1 Tax=Limnohabitans sp. TaxID=1907725 RepID=UPI0039BD405D|nr:hypothetical protein [Comamonadaceae bacterium]